MRTLWILGLALPVVAHANVEQCSTETFSASGLTVTSASWEAPEGNVHVENCLVRGVLNPYVGQDNRDYAIDFELRLPKDWSQQFAYQFNGGADGVVKPALGNLSSFLPKEYAVNRGMAVVSTNGGHDPKHHKDMGLASGSGFGFDAKARARYGYAAVEEMYPVANRLIEQFYGAPASYRYGIGPSNGGRMAMVAASRFPNFFDGLMVGYPGFNLPKAAIQHAWDVQHLYSLTGDLKTSFSREQLSAVGDYVVKQCDNLDGLEDGLIFNASQCQNLVDMNDLVCQDSNTCLSQEQADVLIAMHQGPTNSAGQPLYSDWYFDAGIGSENWRVWKIESPVPAWGYNPIIGAMGSSALATVFTTPPTPVDGDPKALIDFLLEFDFDKDAPRIYAETEHYPESAMDFMTPPDVANPTLAGFKAAGGKMIIYHGNSDPVFSVADTIRWYKMLDKNHNGKANEFVNFYQVPGMPHGNGGPSLDHFDTLSSLVAWVEQDKKPGRIISSALPDKEVSETLQGATRPLCPFPTIAVYNGGDTKDAASFVCR
ncbi:tannase/feruloyl esterase family alpha/beta hydrolase [Marinomonas piezotolerans]|uniref:Tannase/feruloyl esterase family alpha/beta hydrolase n=1 Tax=Marinomonas piezotolerans TaxID=2213058 RepID=A0A370U958_9GAMM|nr:tannase/feruloyl esterase family alpha/beta hydrolase [Marinomonas piezotolerans]RDL44301.1 tannase/feruloyl esterase family alpha/beta hydrolase [Marinomonas piezotolerans]